MRLVEKLSQKWLIIQGDLFGWVEDKLGPLTKKQQLLVTVLEMARVEEYVSSEYGRVGCPPKDRCAIARAFVAKAVYDLSTTRHLLDRLKCDPSLRRLCGWGKYQEIPSEATFSRAFSEFTACELGQRVHAALVEEYQSERLVGHISRDGTAIEAREATVKKEVVVIPKKRGRPKKDEVREAPAPTRLERQQTQSLDDMVKELPTACDVGTKCNSQGYKISWHGYKLHVDTADGGIPISVLLTSASVHDSQVALPLATMTAERVDNCYDLMDAAYDSKIIRAHSAALGHVALIDFNHRSKKDTRCFLPHEAQRYKERSTAERTNARLKDEFGASSIYVRGHAKVMTHLMFGVIALTVDQLMRLVT